MDQIDEWMNRVSDKDSSSEPKTKGSAQAGAKKQGAHHHGQSAHKKHTNKPAQAKLTRRKPSHGKPAHNKPKHKPDQNRRKNSAHKGNQKQHSHRHAKPAKIVKGQLKMIPLGGLDEVGKNMMAIEYENDIIILDMGFEFPSEDMLGIDYVIPDTTYLEDNKSRIRGIVITHGHLDHIGGIPYILPRLDFPPVFATRLTAGIIKKRSEEFKQDKIMDLRIFNADEKIKLGCFMVSFIRVTHSIPDCVAIVVDTPVGKIMDTGDFKFDDNPAIKFSECDVKKLEKLKDEKVLALFCESTNALKPGHSMSEKEVGETLDRIVSKTEGRLIVASFSSQIGRIQQILDAAKKHNRKVFVSGRSMRTNIEICSKLGYINVSPNDIKDVKSYNKGKNKTPDNETLIITTGSQGESIAALARMARMEHAHVKVKKDDTIVLSSSPIVGNEKAINTIINRLTMLGADVIHNQIMDVHTSGHGKQDELARMINYVKPKYLIPIHGEYYMRKGLARLAEGSCDIKEDKIIMLKNGDVLIANKDGKVMKSKEKVETKYILIDGSGEGKLGAQVLVDREIMSQNGVLIVLTYVDKKTGKLKKRPDVLSRGFIYRDESDEIIREVCKLAEQAYKKIHDKNPKADRRDIKNYIRQTIDKFTRYTIDRRPLIVPLMIES